MMRLDSSALHQEDGLLLLRLITEGEAAGLPGDKERDCWKSNQEDSSDDDTGGGGSLCVAVETIDSSISSSNGYCLHPTGNSSSSSATLAPPIAGWELHPMPSARNNAQG